MNWVLNLIALCLCLCHSCVPADLLHSQQRSQVPNGASTKSHPWQSM